MLQPRVRTPGPSGDGVPDLEGRSFSSPRPTGGTSCIPLCGVCAAGGGNLHWKWWAAFSHQPRCFHLALRGRALPPPSMPRADGMLGTRETKPGGERASCMPCRPPGSPHMRLQVSLGCGLKSLSGGSCLACWGQESVCRHPQASSFPLPSLASSWPYYVFRQLWDRAMPREHPLPAGSARRGFLL